MTTKTFLIWSSYIIWSIVVIWFLIIRLFFPNYFINDDNSFWWFVDWINFEESNNPKEIIKLFIYNKNNQDYYFYSNYYIYSERLLKIKTLIWIETLNDAELKKLHIEYIDDRGIDLYDETYEFNISTRWHIYVSWKIKENWNTFRLRDL